MKKIYTTALRLNLEDESDRRAYERLKSAGRSVSKTVASPVSTGSDFASFFIYPSPSTT